MKPFRIEVAPNCFYMVKSIEKFTIEENGERKVIITFGINDYGMSFNQLLMEDVNVVDAIEAFMETVKGISLKFLSFEDLSLIIVEEQRERFIKRCEAFRKLYEMTSSDSSISTITET